MLIREDIHTHVAMLNVNLKFIVSTPTPTPLTSVVAVKFISDNLSIFCEKWYLTAIPSYVFFLQYLTEDSTIEVILCITFMYKKLH